MRIDRRARRRDDLEQLSSLLGLADKFGPRHQIDEQMAAAQLQEQLARNASLQQLMPWQVREAAARVGGMESENDFLGQQRPLQLADMQSVTKARDVGTQFDQRTLEDRARSVMLARQMAEQQYKLGQQTFDADVAARNMQPQMQRVQMGATRAGTQAQRQETQQRATMFQQQQAPERLALADTGRATEIAAMLSQMGMIPGGPRYDIASFLAPYMQGTPMLPEVPQAQGGAPQTRPDGGMTPEQLNSLLGEGMAPSWQSDAGKEWYQSNLPPLLMAMSNRQKYQWSPVAQALQDIMLHPELYGVSQQTAMSGINDDIVQQALRSIMLRKQQSASPLLPPPQL